MPTIELPSDIIQEFLNSLESEARAWVSKALEELGHKRHKYQREIGVRTELHFVDSATPECRKAGTVCEHCKHFISRETKCGLFQMLKAPVGVKPDSYCDAFV